MAEVVVAPLSLLVAEVHLPLETAEVAQAD
jgi:hypothetical protein